ncbi:MAG TPA: alpha/beta hydrolase [Pyrinomonadaceae bacterium]|nr:alpha/beta hydrolase [Pyrinomonadaceae bacterium]
MLSNTKSILSKSSIFFMLVIFACQGAAAQETKAKGEYAAVNGLKMYYEVHGTGQPLVLLHGSFVWATNYPALAQGRQVILVDMQGHGRTADINRPFTFEQMADDTAALLKHLKIEQADVFGYGMGGTIGLGMAIRHPGLVRRLAICSAVYRNVLESYPQDILDAFKEMTPEKFAPKELKDPYDKMSPAPNWKGLVAKIVRMEEDFKGFTKDEMKAIKAEVFIGAGDRYDVSLEHVVDMHSLIPKSQLAIFPNADHQLLFTNPDKILPQIKEFLNTHKKD